MRDALKKSLAESIAQFNRKRTQLLQAAFNEGGQEAVLKLESEYDALRDAHFEILRSQLDETHHAYEELTDRANLEAQRLSKSIDQLEKINVVIDLATKTINAVGRVLIVLGV